jgi:predicted DNA-binding antitoxin AbrB/MazE fold protein
MLKTLRAKYTKGIIKPLEKLHLREGKEITITISEFPTSTRKKDAFATSAGSWKGTIDADKLIKDIYESRSISTRPEPNL